MLEEQIEQTLRREAVGVGAKIVQFALMMLYNISRWALRQNGKILHKIGEGLQKIVYKQLHEGKISEKTLQRDNGNIHQTAPIAKQDLKTVKQSLKKSGVKYAVEKIPAQKGSEPTYIIHFKGEDLAHIEHAINRAAKQLQHEIAVLPQQESDTSPQSVDKPDTQATPVAHDTKSNASTAPEKTTVSEKSEDPVKESKPKLNQKDVLKKLDSKTEAIKARAATKPQLPTQQRTR